MESQTLAISYKSYELVLLVLVISTILFAHVLWVQYLAFLYVDISFVMPFLGIK